MLVFMYVEVVLKTRLTNVGVQFSTQSNKITPQDVSIIPYVKFIEKNSDQSPLKMFFVFSCDFPQENASYILLY